MSDFPKKNSEAPIAEVRVSKAKGRRDSERAIEETKKNIAIYSQLAGSKGCPADQVFNFVKAGFYLQPKQMEMAAAARRCDAPDGPTSVGVGGARAGGKSAWLFAQIVLDDCQRFNGLKVLYLRKSATAAREQIRDLLIKTIPRDTNGKPLMEYNYREQAGIIDFPNGSFIVIKHFKDEKDIENFLGQEYDVVAIEELTTLTFDKWKNLMTCLRTSKPGWRPRFYGAWNWGGIGHQWVMRVFYDPWERNEQKDTIYIKATVADNTHVNKENKDILASYPVGSWKYKSWYLGDPHFQAGQFFPSWNEDFHVYPNKYATGDESQMVHWGASFDHGLNHPCCFILFGRDKNGILYAVDEYHQNETVPSENAGNILYLLKQHHLSVHDLDFIAAGRDCFSRNAEAKTIASMYSEHGLEFTPAETDRLNRWEIMADMLGNPASGNLPKWYIHNRCKNLISQIPLAQSHETRIGDIQKMNADRDSGEGGDDALESASFYLASDPFTAVKFAKPVSLSRKPFQALGFC